MANTSKSQIVESNQPNILSTRRIATNAILLYIRTFVVLCISLYVSRIVLAELGAEDLGIYNVVGGIVTLMAFFQLALTNSTGRYITYDLGAGTSEQQQKQTFSACLGIHVLIVIVIFILGETIGLWVLHNYTSIPTDRFFASKIIYQLSLLTLSMQILTVPYSAAIIAHEKMSVYAAICIAVVVLKLGGVMLIPFIASDSLILYGVILFLVALMNVIFSATYVLHKMPAYRAIPKWHKKTSIGILKFSGWTLLGSTTNTATQQGVALLFNNFISLIANAALGFANQVNAALVQFVNSFMTAFNPQIIKICAAKDYDSLHKLMTMASKTSFILAYIVALPLITNMDYLLHLWLEDVPEFTKEFCQLIIACTVIDATTGVYNKTITATGQIKNYQIAISISFLLDLICAYFLLYLHFHPALVFGSRILTRGLINMVIGLYYTHTQVFFGVKKYTRQALLPILLVLILTTPINYYLTLYFNDAALLLISTLTDIILVTILSFLIILNSSERTSILNLVRQKIMHK